MQHIYIISLRKTDGSDQVFGAVDSYERAVGFSSLLSEHPDQIPPRFGSVEKVIITGPFPLAIDVPLPETPSRLLDRTAN